MLFDNFDIGRLRGIHIWEIAVLALVLSCPECPIMGRFEARDDIHLNNDLFP